MQIAPLDPAWALSRSAARGGRCGVTARALLVLAKPRLALLSILTAMSAFAAASEAAPLRLALATCVGAALAAGGALSLNHWMERRTDALMTRTRERPLPAGIVSPGLAFAWSASLSASGVALLSWQANPTAGVVAAAIIVLYGLVYTPLKRRTRWATEIGSLSGALPPILGAAAAGDALHPAGLSLAAALLFWQMPHFYAIGWRYREDYRAAGFPLLPAIDPDGQRTARWSLAYLFCLLAVTLAPWAFGWLGPVYAAGAVGAGYWFLYKGWRFLRASDAQERTRAARDLFLASLIHMTCLSLALALDRLF